MKSKMNNYINHVAMVMDASSSMGHLATQVVKVADAQTEYLARRSKELDQETRVSVYTFSDTTKCVTYDKDALRLPSLAGNYRASGNTALIDATLKAISDLEKTATLYGDHSFLIYVITDGEENQSRGTSTVLAQRIGNLPDNWTLGVFVPDANGIHEAKKFGFPAQNISVWDTSSSKGMSEVGEVMRQATDRYMTSRSVGIRGTKNLFTLDTSALTGKSVSQTLVKKRPGEYTEIPVRKEQQIHEAVSKFTGKEYVIGSAFYQLTKRETIQPQKSVAIRDKKNGNLYVGQNARNLLNLPDGEVRVNPGYNTDYDIFVQSGSVNRKVLPGTVVIVP